MTKIKTLRNKKTGEKYAPRTHVKAVYDDQGNTLDSLLGVQDEKLSELGQEVSNLNKEVFGESINLYDSSKQTPETISPHYYVGGVPYSDTSFDSKYNATALFEIEQNTEYTIGLVPPMVAVSKPWGEFPQGIFFYDKDENYIGGASSTTFTTPAGTKYARFNYAIVSGITLECLNAKCMIVKGSELPTEYEPFGKSTLVDKVKELESMIADSTDSGRTIFYRINEDEVELYQKKGTNTDFAIVLKRKGGNNLFDFYKVLKRTNVGGLLSTTLSDYTELLTSSTDWHAPFKVIADENEDGDNKKPDGSFNDFFTGGNHQYNNTGSGSTATAKSINLRFYADGKRVVGGESGYASFFEMNWSNQVQGQNTTKYDGTGRFILQENHRMLFDGVSFITKVELIPLEDIHVKLWYGFQALYSGLFTNIRFVDGNNRGLYSLPSYATSGEMKECKSMLLKGDGVELNMSVDTSIDLGQRDYNVGVYSAFAETYGKVYFGIISTSSCAMTMGNAYYLDGKYEFLIE